MNLSGYEINFKPLRERMDNDLKLYYLEKFTLTGEDGKTELPHSTSITMNGPKTFADECMNMLGEDKRIFDFKGPGVDASILRVLEADYDVWLPFNDFRLGNQFIEPLDMCHNFFGIHRGWLANLALMYKWGDFYMPCIEPLDVRWMMWQAGHKGLKWASYAIRMDKEEAEETYDKKFPDATKDVELQVAWDEQNYYVFDSIDAGTPFKTEPHYLGIVPIAITPIPTQPMLITGGKQTTADALARQGEGIYAANRELYYKLNELVSVWASINKQQFLTPLAYVGTRKGFTERPFGHGIVVSLLPDEKLLEIPTKEMSATAQTLFGQVFADIQRGSMSNIDYGQLSQAMAASAVAQLQNKWNGKLNPRRRGKATHYAKTQYLLKYQLTHQCFETEIDDEDAIEIKAENYKSKYIVGVRFESVSPEENIINYQLLGQAVPLRLMGRRKMLRDILHDPDPEGTLREADADDAHNFSKALMIYDQAIAIAPDKGGLKDDEISETRADILLWELGRVFSGEVANDQQPGNLASQPKMNTNVGNEVGQRLAKKMQDMSVNRASRKAETSKTGA